MGKFIIFLFVSIIPLIFDRHLYNAFDLPKFASIFLLTSFMIFYFLKTRKDKITIKKKNFLFPLFSFLLWNLFTGIKSINIFETLKTFLILFLFINFYFFSSEIFERSDIERIMKFLIYASIFISIYGFLQIFGIDFVNWTIKKTPLSTLGRRNFAGEYLVMIIPFTYIFIINSKSPKEKFFYIFSFFLFFMHLIFTFTRASYLGFFISTILFLFLLKIKIPVKKVITVGIFFILFSNSFSQNGFGFEKGTIKSRIYIWQKTLNIFKKNPFIGVGAGNFKINFLLYAEDRPYQIALIKEVLEDVHNDFLEILVETGIIGFLIFLFILFQIFKTSYFTYKKEKILTSGILCSIVGLLFNSLASFPFKKPSTLLIFYLNLSFLEILSEKEFYKLKIPKKFLVFYLILFSISGSIIFYRGIKGNYYYKKAVDTEKLLPFYSKDMAIYSIKYNPFNYKTYFMVGNFYLNKGELDLALFYFKKSEELFPYIDTLQNNIGITYFKKLDYKMAEKHFLLSLKLNKYRAETYNNIGSLYLETGKIDNAIYYLEKCIEIEPKFYIAYFNLGIAYLEKKDNSRAREYFEKVLKIKNDFKPAIDYLKRIK